MSAEGLKIGRPSRPYTVGPLLGRGACGSVHALLPPPPPASASASGEGGRWAVKLAPLPPSLRPGGGAGKKRRKTEAERNADLIMHEYTVLQNAGGGRGRTVPDIPFGGAGPSAYGETDGGGESFFASELCFPRGRAIRESADVRPSSLRILRTAQRSATWSWRGWTAR